MNKWGEKKKTAEETSYTGQTKKKKNGSFGLPK